jgi:hypothetical protein
MIKFIIHKISKLFNNKKPSKFFDDKTRVHYYDKKVAYSPVCGSNSSQETDDINEVTCERCLAYIKDPTKKIIKVVHYWDRKHSSHPACGGSPLTVKESSDIELVTCKRCLAVLKNASKCPP